MAQRKTTLLLILLLAAALFTHNGYAAKLPGYESTRTGTFKHKLDLRINGFRRSYLVHIPKNYDQNKPTPLVVALHGAFDTAKEMERQTGFSEKADRENFIVLYPNGMTLFGLLQHWNARYCCGKAMKDGIDDLGFVAGLIEQAQAHLNVDPKRIYMVGYSNGGMLAYLFASEKPEILAAVAILSSTIGNKSTEGDMQIPEPKLPVPMIIFHGREDETIPYEGELQLGKTGEKGHDYVPVIESAIFWAKYNGCTEPVTVDHLLEGGVLKQTWSGCKDGSETVLFTIEGWNHDPPTRLFTDKLPPSNPIKGFHATDIIWEFFMRHPKR